MHDITNPHPAWEVRFGRRVTDPAAALLVLLWVYAALSKALDFGHFIQQLHNQNLPAALAPVLAWALPAAELMAAGLLMARKLRWYGLILSLALLSVFTVYIGLVLLDAWARIPCSCGGVIGRLSWGWHFVFNCFFLGCTAAGLLGTPGPRQRPQAHR